MKNVLRYGDLIGNRIGLKMDDAFYYKSPVGGLITLMIGILSAAVIISFGLQIINKTNEKVILTNSYQELPYVNLTNNFPMIINVVKRGAFTLDNFQSYYNISVINYNLQLTNGKPVVTLTPKKVRICQDEDFIGRKSQFLSTANPSNSSLYFCLEQNQTLEMWGNIGTTKVNYLAVLINRCVNGTEIVCKSRSDIDAQFENMFVQFIVSNYYFDSSNFTEPGQVYFKSTNIPITTDFYKRAYMYFSNVDYYTDYGLIFEDKTPVSYYAVDSYKEQIFFGDNAAFTPDTISEITLTMQPLKIEYFRSYYKLQSLAADVGGIVKAFTIVFSFLNSILHDKFVNVKIVEDIFNYSNVKADRPTVTKKPTINNVNSYEISPTNFNFFTTTPRVSKINLKSFAGYNCWKSRKNVRIIDLSKLIVNTSLDVRTVIKKLNEAEILKNVMLNRNEIMSVNYLSENNFILDKIENERLVPFQECIERSFQLNNFISNSQEQNSRISELAKEGTPLSKKNSSL